jgi:hypothetical protein
MFDERAAGLAMRGIGIVPLQAAGGAGKAHLRRPENSVRASCRNSATPKIITSTENQVAQRARQHTINSTVARSNASSA